MTHGPINKVKNQIEKSNEDLTFQNVKNKMILFHSSWKPSGHCLNNRSTILLILFAKGQSVTIIEIDPSLA